MMPILLKSKKFGGNVRALLLGAIVMILGGCGSTMVKQWDDDYGPNNRYRGGEFSYLNEGIGPVKKMRLDNGISKAKNYCGERQVFLLTESNSTSIGAVAVPVSNTTNTIGTVSSGGQTANFSATSTSTSNQTMFMAWRHKSISFICQDMEPIPITVLRNDGVSAPVCEQVEAPWAPGKNRLESLANRFSSEDCREEGWIRAKSQTAKKYHIFVEEKGAKLCQSLEGEIVDQQVKYDELNLWMRKRLTCPDNEPERSLTSKD
jgi:hypothetical protein